MVQTLMAPIEPEERCRLLAEKICTILEQGFEFSKKTLHFIDSTFSSPLPETLKSILSNEESDEADTLMSLLFFPDAATQLQLEDFLETGGFDETDVSCVVKFLIESDPKTPFRFPGSTEPLTLAMPPWAGRQFVARLHIFKKIDERLSAAVHRHLPQNRMLSAKVRLRNSRFAVTEDRILFLADLFEKIPDDDLSCLDFILAFFEERPDHADIFESLMERKRHCFHSLQKAEKFHKMLQADNIETLMMRGVRMAYVDREDMRMKMRLIDRICLSIYGKTEYFQPPEAVLGVGDYSPG